MTTADSSGGRSGRSSDRGVGASLKMREATCITLSPTNGARPASASKRIVPIDQMSARASTSLDCTSCSGGEYTGEPTNDDVVVSLFSEPVPEPDVSSALEIPKSSTLTSGVPSG